MTSLLLGAGVVACSFWMPGVSYDKSPPSLTDEEQILRDRLREHVYALSEQIGERNAQHFDKLEQARTYIENRFRLAGYATSVLPFIYGGAAFHNVEAILAGKGASPRCIVVGAHYDSVEGSPGANDNASGVAALLELAHALRGRSFSSSIRFVAFANEEPPYFNTGEGMGSVEYLRGFEQAHEQIRAMLSLETIGFYSDEAGSQHYPPLVGLLYPDRGNFIAFVGNFGSRELVRTTIGRFRSVVMLPSEGAALPSWIPGVSWSDHRSFWDAGIPALMITDTAPFRYPHYHRPSDTPEHLDYVRMARLIQGLEQVLIDLADQK
ncbi:MAG: M28 family peptidase [Methylococcales bacterium]